MQWGGEKRRVEEGGKRGQRKETGGRGKKERNLDLNSDPTTHTRKMREKGGVQSTEGRGGPTPGRIRERKEKSGLEKYHIPGYVN